jgi:multisubunit Na+/H+ antiporter MnhF subunit
MAEPHPAASHHLPAFITAPGETDVLMVVTGLFLALAVVMFGVLFLRLHSLPDQIAHKSHKLQSEIVCVLCLIALFTHMHIFWVAALLLAMIDIPDFGGSLARIATSAEKIADVRPGEDADAPPVAIRQADEPRGMSIEAQGAVKEGAPAASPTKPDIPPARRKEPSHA